MNEKRLKKLEEVKAHREQLAELGPRQRVKLMPPNVQIKRLALRKKLAEQVDRRLNMLAGLLGLPVANLIRIMAKAIGVPPCASCQLRYQILKKAQELGWRKVLALTYASVKAQIQVDEAKLEEIAKEVNQK